MQQINIVRLIVIKYKNKKTFWIFYILESDVLLVNIQIRG